MSNVASVTDATFASEVEGQEGLTVVDFWATWCGPCRMIAPILDQLAGEYQGRARVVKLDVDQNPGVASKYRVTAMPTLLFFRDGKVVDQVIGAYPRPHLAAKFEEHVAA